MTTAAFELELRSWLDANAERSDHVALAAPFGGSSDDPAEAVAARAWMDTLYRAGWGVITWPTEHGGRDASPAEVAAFWRLLDHYEMPPLRRFRFYLIGTGMIGPTIIEHGTEAQRERYLPPLARGSEVWCQLWSEPDAGSDLASLKTRATPMPDGEGWLVSGQKVWTSDAHFARWGLLLARTDTEVPKHRGLTCFVVDMQHPGVTVRPLRQMTGLAEFNEVFFENVPVPASDVIGDVRAGWQVAITTLMNERYAGGAEGSLVPVVETLASLARAARSDGRIPSVHADLLSQLYARAFVLDKTTDRYLADAGSGVPGAEGSVLKALRAGLVSDLADASCLLLGMATLLLGDDGFDGGRWAEAMMWAPGFRIGGGTDEIVRNIIGERVLGLPKEPPSPGSR